MSSNAASIATAQRVLASCDIGVRHRNDTNGKPLDTHLHEDTSLRTARAIQVLHHVVQGILAMHAAGIVHGDLRCGNIFVAPGDRVLLGGLDHCFVYNAGRFGILSDKPASELGVSVSRSTRWLAPECVAGGVPTPASDVYALGLTIYEAMTGEAPYTNVDDAKLIEMKKAQAAAATSFSASSNVSTGLARGDQLRRDVWSLIQEMTRLNPMVRPSMQIVLMGIRELQAKMTSAVSKQPQGQSIPVATSPIHSVRAASPSTQQTPAQRVDSAQCTPVQTTTLAAPRIRDTPPPQLPRVSPHVVQPVDNSHTGQVRVHPQGFLPSPPRRAPAPSSCLSNLPSVGGCFKIMQLLVMVGALIAAILTIAMSASSSRSSDSTPTPTPRPTRSYVETLAVDFAKTSLSGIAVTRNGTVLVSDANRIYKILERVSAQPFVGDYYGGYFGGCGAFALFSGIRGLAIDTNDNVYVADSYNRRLRTFAFDQDCVSDAAGNGTHGTYDSNASSTTFYSLSGLAIDINNDVYIADEMANNVRKLTSRDTVSTPISYVEAPGAIAVAPQGEIYIVRYSAVLISAGDGNSVRVFVGDPFSSGYKDGSSSIASFNRISAIALSSKGDALFVVDTDNHCIRNIVLATAEVSTLAGTCGVVGSADGNDTRALFHHPIAIAVHGDNLLYVAELAGYRARVRKITLQAV